MISKIHSVREVRRDFAAFMVRRSYERWNARLTTSSVALVTGSIAGMASLDASDACPDIMRTGTCLLQSK
jgi:hypothetical protein